jgi:hypothetical protein
VTEGVKMILTLEQVVDKYSISRPTALKLFASHGSPAFKIGEGRGHWRVDENKLEQFLIKRSEEFKG